VEAGSSIVRGKKVLELGAGTGLVSILSARWLNAKHVTATDGADEVLEDLQNNMFLNELEGSKRICVKSLRWGRVLDEDEGGQPPDYDIVLGADIVCRMILDNHCLQEDLDAPANA
jgi:predicted nicotinamide N-methyase